MEVSSRRVATEAQLVSTGRVGALCCAITGSGVGALLFFKLHYSGKARRRAMNVALLSLSPFLALGACCLLITTCSRARTRAM